MLRAYKYRLYPTQGQCEMLDRHFGSVRFIYNLALQTKMESWRYGVSVSAFDLIKQLPGLKEECTWLKEVNAQSLQASIKNLESAYQQFFRRVNHGEKPGFPRFKKRGSKQNFMCPQRTALDFEAGLLSIPKIKGILCEIDRRFNGVIKTVTISKTASQKYFASVLVETGTPLPQVMPCDPEHAVGIDMGITTFATLSTGEKFVAPMPLQKQLKSLARVQRTMSRRQRGSKNRGKARHRVVCLYERITNIRKDCSTHRFYRQCCQSVT